MNVEPSHFDCESEHGIVVHKFEYEAQLLHPSSINNNLSLPDMMLSICLPILYPLFEVYHNFVAQVRHKFVQSTFEKDSPDTC